MSFWYHFDDKILKVPKRVCLPSVMRGKYCTIGLVMAKEAILFRETLPIFGLSSKPNAIVVPGSGITPMEHCLTDELLSRIAGAQRVYLELNYQDLPKQLFAAGLGAASELSGDAWYTNPTEMFDLKQRQMSLATRLKFDDGHDNSESVRIANLLLGDYDVQPEFVYPLIEKPSLAVAFEGIKTFFEARDQVPERLFVVSQLADVGEHFAAAQHIYPDVPVYNFVVPSRMDAQLLTDDY
jgi:hypothetical protein